MDDREMGPPYLERTSLMLAAAVPLVTAAIESVTNGVDAAVAVEMDGEGDADDEDDETDGSKDEVRC
ncbi:hypothetical protein EDD11_002646 [Mortierella claussenii]|nr:hypothetical protein EDD11_002646 [Mortierella claussenii]